jgi:pimeloyl-ACP methyl ester carboxylesterase
LVYRKMTKEILWLSVCPRLRGLDRSLLRVLSVHHWVRQWEYCADLDQGTSFETAMELLQAYFVSRPLDAPPIHLVGHGLSGVLALEYARRHPTQIQSLSLLGVAAQPDVTWHRSYYQHRQRLISDRQTLLRQMVYQLFERPLPYPVDCLKTLLARNLEVAPNLHASGESLTILEGGVKMPLLICGSQTDPIVTPTQLSHWRKFLKPTDRLWLCEQGKHFFHFAHPQCVGTQLLEFWQSLPTHSCPTTGTEVLV